MVECETGAGEQQVSHAVALCEQAVVAALAAGRVADDRVGEVVSQLNVRQEGRLACEGGLVGRYARARGARPRLNQASITGFDIAAVTGEAISMNVSLTDQLEQFVTELVQSGRYRYASEVVREGLQLLAMRDESDRVKLEALRRMIQEGIDSGPAAPLDMDEIIATARAGRVRRA